MLRAYRADGSMNDAANVVVPDGADLAPALAEILARDDVVEVHARARTEQCFTFAVVLVSSP